MNTIERKIPVKFQKLNTYDDRFISVKIWLMHLGQNFNGSYFSKEVVESAIPSLANTPILGYVVEKDNGELDFSDHRMVLVKNDKGKYELKYIGQAFGVIPETNNARFETRIGDDGVEREYLTVEGLIWNKWNVPEEILLRDLDKGQSMELADNHEGYYDKGDKLYHFTNFKFFGACMLGDVVQPAMEGAEIEVQFSMASNFDKEIQENVEKFKALYSSYQLSNEDTDINFKEKDGENMKEKLLPILEKYSLTEDMAIEKGINLADFDSEELFEAKVKEVTEFSAEPEIQEPEIPVEPEVVIDPEVPTNFSLTGQQLVQELNEELSKSVKVGEDGYSYQDLWLVDYLPDQSIVIAYDCDSNELVGLSYTISGDEVTIDLESEQEYKIQYVPVVEPAEESNFSLVPKSFSDAQIEKRIESTVVDINEKFSQIQAEKDELSTKFTTLEEEVLELRQFKSTKSEEEREAQVSELFAQFSEQLTEEEVATAKEQFSQLNVEEIEKELFAIVGKKTAKFSKKEKAAPAPNKVPVFSKQEPEQSGYAYIIEKALNTK